MTSAEDVRKVGTIVRSNRTTIGLEIKADGTLYIRIPYDETDKAVNLFLESKLSWINKYYNKVHEKLEIAKDVEPYSREDLQRLAEKALKVIPQRVEHYAKIIGVDYGRITIRNQKTRWGSCTSKGNLNFNCLLMEFPKEVIDSIVVHELCHRKHMNHSPKFYAEVERAFPEYWKWHRWLNEHGGVYLARMR